MPGDNVRETSTAVAQQTDCAAGLSVPDRALDMTANLSAQCGRDGKESRVQLSRARHGSGPCSLLPIGAAAGGRRLFRPYKRLSKTVFILHTIFGDHAYNCC